ncbi:MAG: hypothetical protein ABI622_06920 [Chloroflexota bacterium]
MAEHLYVAGGRQRGLRPLTAALDWYQYEAGVLLRVDAEKGTATRQLEYVSPPEVIPDEGATILFKSGSLAGDHLYMTTQTEVLIYRLPDFVLERHISIPQFNDLHHVILGRDGSLVVAATGMDMVFEIDLDGTILREHDVTGNGLWHRFSRDTDYRKVATTKPHAAHPNYVFRLGDEIWATRFEHRDAVSVVDPSRRIDIGVQRVHDGVVRGERIYFTTVDGHVAIANAQSLTVDRVVDLTKSHPRETVLGWTRSIYPVDDRHAWVGFSRIRPTKFRENVGWVARGFRRDIGTHIGLYDLESGECLQQIELEKYGLSAVFGIYPVPPAP